MIGTIAKFDSLDVAWFGVESEVVVKTPSVGTQTTDLRETWGCFTLIARFVRHLENWNEMFEAIGIVDFRERPCQLEASTNQQLIGIVTERGDLRIEVGDSDVFTT